jgi:hypothetical protein
MPVAEISAGLTSLRAALDITKAMVSLRDAEAFRAKSIELQGIVLEAWIKPSNPVSLIRRNRSDYARLK